MHTYIYPKILGGTEAHPSLPLVTPMLIIAECRVFCTKHKFQIPVENVKTRANIIHIFVPATSYYYCTYIVYYKTTFLKRFYGGEWSKCDDNVGDGAYGRRRQMGKYNSHWPCNGFPEMSKSRPAEGRPCVGGYVCPRSASHFCTTYTRILCGSRVVSRV